MYHVIDVKGEQGRASSSERQTAPAKPRDRKLGRWRRYSGVVFGFILLAAVIYIAIHAGEEQRFVELARNAEPFWLAAGFAYQAATYLCSAAIWWVVLKRFDIRSSIWSLSKLSLAKLSIEKIIPAAGIGGSLLLIRGLEGRGASGPVAAAALLIDVLSIYAARAISVVVAIVILWINEGLHVVIIIVCVIFALFSAGILGGIFWLTSIDSEDIPKWINKIPGVGSVVRSIADAPPEAVHSKRLLWQATALQLLIIVLDAATLDAMLRSIGHIARPDHLFASFSMASVASTLTFIPGGIGAFEGVSVLMLRLLHVPIEAGLAATLMLRAFILWLPMIPGFFILRRESRHLVEADI